MIKSAVLATAAAVLAIPASAATFTEQGVTYTYTVRQTGKAQLISGFDENQRPFELRVVGRSVNGHVDGYPVTFSMPQAKRAVALDGRLASR